MCYNGLGEDVSSGEKRCWYAFHIYRNSRKQFISRLVADAQQYYVAEQVNTTLQFDYNVETTKKLLFPSIVFVKCTAEYVEAIRSNQYSNVAPYTYPGTKEPAVISNREMEVFMFVLNTGSDQMDIVDEKIVKGDKVRVTEGVFKGAEGHIVRIKGNRRFVVSINGIAAVATSYIPQKFLEKI